MGSTRIDLSTVGHWCCAEPLSSTIMALPHIPTVTWYCMPSVMRCWVRPVSVILDDTFRLTIRPTATLTAVYCCVTRWQC